MSITPRREKGRGLEHVVGPSTLTGRARSAHRLERCQTPKGVPIIYDGGKKEINVPITHKSHDGKPRKSTWVQLLTEDIHDILYQYLLCPEERPLLRAFMLGKVQPGELVSVRWVRRDGTTIWTEQKMVPFFDSLFDVRPAVHGTSNTSGHRELDEPPGKAGVLLKTKEKIQGEKNWRKGLRAIAESMNMLGYERYGIFLVDDLGERLQFYAGEGVNLLEGTSIRFRDAEHPGVMCLKEKRTVTSYAENEMSCYSYLSVWVPIVIRDEPRGALAAHAMRNVNSLADEDIRDLENVADMLSAFIDRMRTEIEPVAEKKSRSSLKYNVDPGEACIVLEKKHEKSLKIFRDLVNHGIPGFVVSRVHPEILRKKYGLAKIPMLWLSQSEGENTIAPDDLHMLEYIVKEFTRKSKEPVILLEGLEYLIVNIGFKNTLQYVHELKDIAILSNARLIMSLHKDALFPEEYNMLRKEAVLLQTKSLFSSVKSRLSHLTVQ